MDTTHFVHVLLYERCVGCPTDARAKMRPPCSLSVKLHEIALSVEQLLTGCQDMYVFCNSVNCSIGITQLEEFQ